jgi:hypothetical protein
MINKMTKEEALKKVKGYLTDYLPLEDADEIDEIIEALMQQPSENCTIIKKLSRKYYVEDAYGYTDENIVNKVNEIIDVINELSSITPPSKIGHWIIVDDCERFIAKCSECGRIEDSRMISKYPYCHCGARMVDKQERSDKE